MYIGQNIMIVTFLESDAINSYYSILYSDIFEMQSSYYLQ